MPGEAEQPSPGAAAPQGPAGSPSPAPQKGAHTVAPWGPWDSQRPSPASRATLLSLALETAPIPLGLGLLTWERCNSWRMTGPAKTRQVLTCTPHAGGTYTGPVSQVTVWKPWKSSREESTCLQVKKPEDTWNNSVIQNQVREWHRDLHPH